MFENIKKYSIFIMVLGFLTWSFSPLTVLSKTTVNLNDQVMKQTKEFKKEYLRLYRKTKIGLITQIYNHQKQKSVLRNHEQPKYTRLELIEWCTSQDIFDKLYKEWENSNYNKKLIPSIDRLDDYKGYSFNNIQIITWEENDKKAHIDTINGKNNKMSKAVLQYDLDGNFIKEYYSTMNAERETGIYHSKISACCKNKIKYYKGYIWKYK